MDSPLGLFGYWLCDSCSGWERGRLSRGNESSRGVDPAHQRSTAMGFINAGTAAGSLLAPPLIGTVLIFLGWRWVFFVAGELVYCG